MILPKLVRLLESPWELQTVQMAMSHLPRARFWNEDWAFEFRTDPPNDSNVHTGLGTPGIEPVLYWALNIC